MEYNKILGVDIGSGYKTSALVDIANFKVIAKTLHSAKVGNKAFKEAVFFNRSEAINKMLLSVLKGTIVNISFAMLDSLMMLQFLELGCR